MYNLRNRGYGISTRRDKNTVVQLDLIGNEMYTGKISHTFQVGLDYRTTDFSTTSQSVANVDVIDIYAPVTNVLPSNLDMGTVSAGGGESRAIGLVAQDVITFNSYLKTFFGLRYSTTESITSTSTTGSDAGNPLGGVILSPFKNINLFGSYTNSSYPRTASRLS